MGEKVPADRAKEVGLVSSVYDDQEEMLKNAFEIAEKLVSKTPLAMWVTKEVLNYSRDHSVKEGLDNVNLWNAATLHKEDVMTTMMSKMQKKKPEYKNLRDKNFLKHKSTITFSLFSTVSTKFIIPSIKSLNISISKNIT